MNGADDVNGRSLSGGTFDRPWVHRQLTALTIARARFRFIRMLQRLRDPRRIVATSLALLFLALYLLNGVFILSARQPADPERLRLWLSGGMVIYAIYHCVRCAWSTSVPDLELTPAEQLWLGGAPIRRSSLAVYHLGTIVMAALMKTFLLAVVLLRDVAHLELLVVGVFTSLVLLESTRLIIGRFAAGLDDAARKRFRSAVSLVAGVLVFQVLARIAAATPLGSPTLMYVLCLFQSLGQTASTDCVQWLSLPWIVPAQIAVTQQYQWITAPQLIASASLVPLSIMILVRVDAVTAAKQISRERGRLESNQFQQNQKEKACLNRQRLRHPLGAWIQRRLPRRAEDTFAVLSRQAISVHRYRGTIVLSFVIPVLLCLSSLATGQQVEQWFYVVGGIAMCTMLLAPPALRLDFRRDLQRMILLRAMPIRPLSMVLGQLTLPILITCVFQWITIIVAAMVTTPGWSQVILWTGMLNALAVFTFASENALFLAFPHHQHSQGVAMMVRAKLTFMGKGAVIAVALGTLALWVMICRNLPQPLVLPGLVGGAILGTWGIAIAAIAACTHCWRRFDVALDVPPQ